MPNDTTLSLPVVGTAKPRKNWARRIVVGGKLSDLGRLPRYAAFALIGGTLIWAPIVGYLKTAPLSYKSHTSLIMPGSGASASMNLNGIGQSSSYANSAFASNAVSPTETYKRLLCADRIVAAAAEALGIPRTALGEPRVNLVDQTSLIHFEMTGASPIDAKARGEAILEAFFKELDALRADEQDTRADSALQAISDYRDSVSQTRDDIARLQTNSGLFSVNQYDVLLDRHLALEVQLNEKAASFSEIDAEVRGLERQLGLDAASAAITLKLFADGTYIALSEQASLYEAALAEANSEYGQRHPKVQEARASRDGALKAAKLQAASVTGLDLETMSKLDLAPQGARANLLSDLVQLDAARAGLRQELETLTVQFEAGLEDLNRKSESASRLQDLERDFSVAEAVFASAIARNQSTKSDVYASYPLVQVLENPSLPEKPSSPNRKLAIAAGAAATLILLLSLVMGWVRLALIGRLLAKPKAD